MSKIVALQVWSWPGGVKKLLDFKQVAVGVAQKAVVDVVIGVVGWWFFKFNASLNEKLVPLINLMGGKGKDYALRFFRGRCSLAET